MTANCSTIAPMGGEIKTHDELYEGLRKETKHRSDRGDRDTYLERTYNMSE